MFVKFLKSKAIWFPFMNFQLYELFTYIHINSRATPFRALFSEILADNMADRYDKSNNEYPTRNAQC